MAPVRAGKARPGEGTGREGLEEDKFRRAELTVHFPSPRPPSTPIGHRAVERVTETEAPGPRRAERGEG